MRERFCRRERRAVPAARSFARDALVAWGLDARLDDVLLRVSELVTNALLHGAPPGRGFRLLLVLGCGRLTVEVDDSGGGVPRSAGEAGGESGRGPALVAALSDEWGVRERVPGKTVWCSWRTEPGPAPERG